MIAFIENKEPDFVMVRELLGLCRAENHWANEGPLFRKLQLGYHQHLGLKDNWSVLPCSNAGIALEAMARVHDQRLGRKVRWVGSAFSFLNLGRGYFADIELLDCDEHGCLDLSKLRKLDPATFDGIVLTNPHGLLRDFAPYIAFVEREGKALLIDNAAGLGPDVPQWPWQAFSLHQTKPYGVGEGGLAIVPSDVVDDLRQLLIYGLAPSNAALWLNNGKLSDIAAAFHLDRLSRHATWVSAYRDQAHRIREIAVTLGYRSLLPWDGKRIAMSWPLLAPRPVPIEKIRSSEHVTLGKFYKPLAERDTASWLYERLVNMPAHPDMERLSDTQIEGELHRLIV